MNKIVGAFIFLVMVNANAQVSKLSQSEMVDHFRAKESITIERGNTPGSVIPDIPELSLSRHEKNLQSDKYKNAELLTYFTDRYKTIIEKLIQNYSTSDFKILNEIKTIAAKYGIKPQHILAAIVGEHVFNVDLKDKAQDYVIKARLWTNLFSDKHPFADIIDCPEMKTCENQESEYMKWECYDSVWAYKMRDKIACGQQTAFVNKGLMKAYFDPTLGGKTYGLGQLGPIKMLSLTDLVNKISGLPKLSIRNQNEVYTSILDPKVTLHYIAAAILNSINIYKKEANMDISNNIGLTATLYNLGYERRRAIELNKANLKNIQEGKGIKLPQTNYYGWFVNYIEQDLDNKLNSSVLR